MERAEWLAKRRETLGASEVAAVCIGERLRPRPGCKSCGVRRFRKIGGFPDGTAYIEHRFGRCRLYRHRGGRWLFGPNDRHRSHAGTNYSLSVCEERVASGRWEELTTECCDGSGTMPARKAVPR